MDRYSRVRTLFGEDFQKLQNAKIILFGVGGVGGVVLECLYRSGVTDITIVDKDRFEITNQNRQLGSEALGELKVDYFSKTLKGVTPIAMDVDATWIEKFDFETFDIVIDCIDDIPAKVALAQKTSQKLIASGGSAKRIDPTLIKVGSIWEAHGDKFVKKFKDSLKKSGFAGDFSVVYSTEPARCTDMGSFMGVTGSFGFMVASLAIKKII